MKKTNLVIALALLASLAACGGGGSDMDCDQWFADNPPPAHGLAAGAVWSANVPAECKQ